MDKAKLVNTQKMTVQKCSNPFAAFELQKSVPPPADAQHQEVHAKSQQPYLRKVLVILHILVNIFAVVTRAIEKCFDVKLFTFVWDESS